MSNPYYSRDAARRCAKIEVWFDAYQFKVWYITFLDSEDNQIGESLNFYNKSKAVGMAKYLRLRCAEASGNAPRLVIGTRAGLEDAA